MKRPEAALRALVSQWAAKADEDLKLVEHLHGEGEHFQASIAFHSQQAVEKYLKAVLTRHQIEFPKTHDIGLLLTSLISIEPAGARELAGAEWLTPFGTLIRYPGDSPVMLPGDETKAVELAVRVKSVVMRLLQDYLSQSP